MVLIEKVLLSVLVLDGVMMLVVPVVCYLALRPPRR
jgi:chromosome condensin MukBEF MukE localization factor